MKKKNEDQMASGGISDHIRGISCNVINCIYHDGDAYCTASGIKVGPSYASSCTDTVCATFKARENSYS